MVYARLHPKIKYVLAQLFQQDQLSNSSLYEVIVKYAKKISTERQTVTDHKIMSSSLIPNWVIMIFNSYMQFNRDEVIVHFCVYINMVAKARGFEKKKDTEHFHT